MDAKFILVILNQQIYMYFIYFILGLFMIGYLGFKWFKNEMSAWLYIHLLVYVPLFMYTGYLGINNMKYPGIIMNLYWQLVWQQQDIIY